MKFVGSKMAEFAHRRCKYALARGHIQASYLAGCSCKDLTDSCYHCLLMRWLGPGAAVLVLFIVLRDMVSKQSITSVDVT